MTDALERWMTGCIAAWDSNDPAAIAALFTDQADDGGRVSSFTEWYMESASKPLGPRPTGAG